MNLPLQIMNFPTSIVKPVKIFLSQMDALLSWPQLLLLLEPYYPKAGNGRRIYLLETMLRIHSIQQRYALGDEAMVDPLYEAASMRMFTHRSFNGAIPVHISIMNVYHLLVKYKLARKILKAVNLWLSDSEILMKQGTLVGTTMIEAPSSSNNEDKQPDRNGRSPKIH